MIPRDWKLIVANSDESPWTVDADGVAPREIDGKRVAVGLEGSEAVIEIGTKLARVPIELQPDGCSLRWSWTDKQLRKATRGEGIRFAANGLADALLELGMRDVVLIPGRYPREIGPYPG